MTRWDNPKSVRVDKQVRISAIACSSQFFPARPDATVPLAPLSVLIFGLFLS
jgi:hypothetical protein